MPVSLFCYMPFFKFHFVEALKLEGISRPMADRIQQVVGCPREHIVFELVHSNVINHTTVKEEKAWPFVEVEYFERPKEVQDALAQVIYEFLKTAGYPDSDVYFRYLQPESYYEDGKCLK